MIIYFYGKDKYRIREKVKDLIDAHKEKNKSGFSSLKDIELEDLRREMLSVSMFSEKKLVIVYDFIISKEFLSQIELFELSSNVLLIVNESDADIDCKKQEFELLSESKLKEWIREKVKDMKGGIDEGAMDLLTDYVGSDLFRMENEIIKLASYSSNISLENVKKLVRDKDELNIFETINYIARKDKKGALQSIKKHLDKGDTPIYILAMIGFQIRKIISAKERGSYNNFTIDELKKLYDKVVELDYGIKTGKINPVESLNILICGV
jgi:DNA polymerase-3 subunit delta